MVEVYKVIARVAKTDTTILITGESGTGKEMVARAIHRNSLRALPKPFLAVNCGALLSETLLGKRVVRSRQRAHSPAPRRNEKASSSRPKTEPYSSTKISETSPAMQTKLLRVLEEREITRVGSMESLKVDVRVIAATNRSLTALVKDGRFREDLFYRLHVVELVLAATTRSQVRSAAAVRLLSRQIQSQDRQDTRSRLGSDGSAGHVPVAGQCPGTGQYCGARRHAESHRNSQRRRSTARSADGARRSLPPTKERSWFRWRRWKRSM